MLQSFFKKQRLSFLFAIMLVAVFSLPALAQQALKDLRDGEPFVLTLLHTNDLHGRLDKVPQYATLIRQVRNEARNLLVLDGGDLFLRGEFSDLKGEPEMRLLNAMGYDAWVIGNNDFRVPRSGQLPENDQALRKLVASAKPRTLCANVQYKKDGSYLNGVEPYTVKNVNGVRVGIIGLTSMKPQHRGYEPDKTFLDPVETLKKCLKELEGQSDVNIVLSHCGLSEDAKLVTVPGVAAVLGADDHYVMEKPVYWVWEGEKSTPIVQHGGEESHMLGRLDLVFVKQKNALKRIDFHGKAYSTDLVPQDPTTRAILDEYRKTHKSKPQLDKAA